MLYTIGITDALIGHQKTDDSINKKYPTFESANTLHMHATCTTISAVLGFCFLNPTRVRFASLPMYIRHLMFSLPMHNYYLS